MSRVGYPYDNATMERCFNTLKNEEIYLHHYHNEQELYNAVQKISHKCYKNA